MNRRIDAHEAMIAARDLAIDGAACASALRDGVSPPGCPMIPRHIFANVRQQRAIARGEVGLRGPPCLDECDSTGVRAEPRPDCIFRSRDCGRPTATCADPSGVAVAGRRSCVSGRGDGVDSRNACVGLRGSAAVRRGICIVGRSSCIL